MEVDLVNPKTPHDHAVHRMVEEALKNTCIFVNCDWGVYCVKAFLFPPLIGEHEMRLDFGLHPVGNDFDPAYLGCTPNRKSLPLSETLTPMAQISPIVLLQVHTNAKDIFVKKDAPIQMH